MPAAAAATLAAFPWAEMDLQLSFRQQSQEQCFRFLPNAPFQGESLFGLVIFLLHTSKTFAYHFAAVYSSEAV